NCELVRTALKRGIICINHLRITHWIQQGCLQDGLNLVANSPYTASKVYEAFGIHSPVILPIVDLTEYKVRSRKRKFITFINPIPQKGVLIATETARKLPHLPFLF